MKKHILLINPWIYDFAAYDFWIKPLGLLYIASLLRLNGYTIELIDCLNPQHPLLQGEVNIQQSAKRVSGRGKLPRHPVPKPPQLSEFQRRYSRYGITPSILLKELSSAKKPDAVFITSMMTYWYPGVFEIIKIVKNIFPGTPVVLGGNYVTLCQEHAAHSGADFLISGDGREIVPLLRHLFDDRDFTFPEEGNLDDFPYPAYDILPFFDQVSILTSRGCPYRCTYCASHVLNKKFIRRDPYRVVDEITFWNTRYGIKHFSFYDDALLVNAQDVAIPMLKEIIKRKLDCSFHCPNGLHVSEITESVSKLMRKAGFKTIRFGFEFSSPTRQLNTGGKVNNEMLRAAVTHLKSAGYTTDEIGVYVLCALPDQDLSEVVETIHFVRDCGARPIIAEYSPIPHTAMWERAVKTSPYDLEREPLFHNNTLLPCRSEKFTYEMYRHVKSMVKHLLYT